MDTLRHNQITAPLPHSNMDTDLHLHNNTVDRLHKVMVRQTAIRTSLLLYVDLH